MRETSARRVDPSSRPKKYAGPPEAGRVPAGAQQPLGPLVARPGSPYPTVDCPKCGLTLKATRVHGRIPSHTIDGHRPSVAKGHPPCLGWEALPPRESG